jgi:hypothetical protein
MEKYVTVLFQVCHLLSQGCQINLQLKVRLRNFAHYRLILLSIAWKLQAKQFAESQLIMVLILFQFHVLLVEEDTIVLSARVE